jgi:RIO-like serine/threonine protein kinase
MVKTLKLPNRIKGPRGSYGMYVKISNLRGIKLLHGSFRSMKSAADSYQMENAKKEAELLEKAYVSGVVPKCYGVKIVKRGTVFRVGIEMQHLGNTRLSDVPSADQWRIARELREALLNVGIRHSDLHNYNVMKKGKKYYAIDFSPCCISIDHNYEQEAA